MPKTKNTGFQNKEESIKNMDELSLIKNIAKKPRHDAKLIENVRKDFVKFNEELLPNGRPRYETKPKIIEALYEYYNNMNLPIKITTSHIRIWVNNVPYRRVTKLTYSQADLSPNLKLIQDHFLAKPAEQDLNKEMSTAEMSKRPWFEEHTNDTYLKNMLEVSGIKKIDKKPRYPDQIKKEAREKFDEFSDQRCPKGLPLFNFKYQIIQAIFEYFGAKIPFKRITGWVEDKRYQVEKKFIVQDSNNKNETFKSGFWQFQSVLPVNTEEVIQNHLPEKPHEEVEPLESELPSEDLELNKVVDGWMDFTNN